MSIESSGAWFRFWERRLEHAAKMASEFNAMRDFEKWSSAIGELYRLQRAAA